MVLLEAQILENLRPESFAKLLAAAVLRQDRGPVRATDQQVAAFAWLEGAAVAGEETRAWSLFTTVIQQRCRMCNTNVVMGAGSWRSMPCFACVLTRLRPICWLIAVCAAGIRQASAIMASALTRSCLCSLIITGGGKWVEISIAADPLYQHLLLTAEKKFWRSVESGEPPRPFGVEPPRPRIEAVRIVDMSASNSWAEFAGVFRSTRAAVIRDQRPIGRRGTGSSLAPLNAPLSSINSTSAFSKAVRTAEATLSSDCPAMPRQRS